jgi:hypothetical protein
MLASQTLTEISGHGGEYECRNNGWHWRASQEQEHGQQAYSCGNHLPTTKMNDDDDTEGSLVACAAIEQVSLDACSLLLTDPCPRAK